MKKSGWCYLCFIVPVKKYDWMIHENLYAKTNQDSTISHTRKV